MELVTGFQGKNHVTARQFSRLISGLATDGETYVLKTLDQLPAELLNANTVSVGTGDIIADGTYFTVEAPEEITIENGATGLNRNDLIVARYLKAEPTVDEDGIPDYTIPRVESGELAVVKGAPSSGDPDDPAVVEASIYDDNTTLAEFPLYRIPIRGLSVGTPEPLFKILPPGAERWDSLSQKIVSGSFLFEVPEGSGERYFDVSVRFPRPMECDNPTILITDMSRRSGYSSMFTDVRAAFFESSSAGFTARIYCTCSINKDYPRTFNYLATAF